MSLSMDQSQHFSGTDNLASVSPLLSRRPSAKRLILSVLSQPNLREMHIGKLIKWGGLFDHAPATMRVTVGRLTKQGLLESMDRGTYKIGRAGEALQKTAASWGSILDSVGPWNGEWISIHTAHLGRSNKTALRTRERAFRLMGFEQLVLGLWCRPANLKAPASTVLERLHALGLEQDAVLSHLPNGQVSGAIDAHGLWPREELEAHYRRAIGLLRTSQQRLGLHSLETGMKESFLVGEHVIRQINADPLLPNELIDTVLREQMVSAMQSYDRRCHPLWNEFLNA